MFASFRPFAALALLLAGAAAPSAAQTAQRQWFEGEPTPLALRDRGDAERRGGDVRRRSAHHDRDRSEALPTVTMNALGLTVSARDDRQQRASQFAANDEAQTLTLTPRRAAARGPSHHPHHLYRRDPGRRLRPLPRRVQDDGQTKRALATQFEPGDARRFAPMWDQPNRRAVFSMTVTAPTRPDGRLQHAGRARAARLAAGCTRTRFADTPSMPSYLLFLAVGDFERVTTRCRRRRARRRRAPRRRRIAPSDALHAGEESLRYFTEYFGIRYPLPKLDMIGVPGAGGFGAMENWGAILYFDQYLLVDERPLERSRAADRVRIVAHEIAHQWFGNLVTMTWWDDLWLNEGFASWMAAKAIEARAPGLEALDGAADRRHGDGDGARCARRHAPGRADRQHASTKPTSRSTRSPTRRASPSSACSKRMSARKTSASGVRDYLNARLYGNARTEDLWTRGAGGVRPARARDRAQLHRPAGLPAADGERRDCRARRKQRRHDRVTPAPLRDG